MQRALGANWPARLRCGRNSSASSDLRCASYFPLPPDLASVVSIWIISRSNRLAVNGSSRGRGACPFHSLEAHRGGFVDELVTCGQCFLCESGQGRWLTPVCNDIHENQCVTLHDSLLERGKWLLPVLARELRFRPRRFARGHCAGKFVHGGCSRKGPG
jgi:hypothetical protein